MPRHPNSPNPQHLGHLTVLVKPRASRSHLVEVRDDVATIALAAPPVDGDANRELLEWLSKALHLPKSHLYLERGAASRHKRVRIPGLSTTEILAILTKLLQPTLPPTSSTRPNPVPDRGQRR